MHALPRPDQVAGTRSGVTALQLDTKLPGLPVQLLVDALVPASEARAKIIAVMEAALEANEARMPKASGPQFGSVEIDRELVPRLIGLQVRQRAHACSRPARPRGASPCPHHCAKGAL